MATFPISEAEILALASAMAAGFKTNATVYPAPPVPLADFAADISDFTAKSAASVQSQAKAMQDTDAKSVALSHLTDAMRTLLRYAENTVNDDDAKLKLLGWSGPRARVGLTPPGQTRVLEIAQIGPDWIDLDWKAPLKDDGGKPAAYKVQKRAAGASNAWTDAALSMETETRVTNLDKGTWEFQVVAANKAGDGPAGNTVSAVL